MVSCGSAVAAAPVKAPVKGGITLSPFEQQLSIAPDDTTRIFNLDLTNNTSSLQELSLSARDFGSLNDTGGVLLEGSKAYAQKYGLTSWLALGTNTVVLQPGEKRSVPVTIENRDSLQPGGHYGAVVASVNSLNGQGDNKVVINQQLLSLILVKKVGGERYNLKLKDVDQNGNWFRLPSKVKLRFQNPGNVHVVPRGVVKLKSPSGKILAQGIINSESAYILPETFRELYVPLTKVASSAPLPGAYSVEVDYRYDGINLAAIKSYPVRFLSLGTYAVLLVIVVVILYVLRRQKRASKKAAITE
ncbi:MAG: hypothetical protein JWO35_696 [Candidatus Saccharibacteria bacterium]|nr:hypothetical protein [Candidatus Saccharibacteria bacterium]